MGRDQFNNQSLGTPLNTMVKEVMRFSLTWAVNRFLLLTNYAVGNPGSAGGCCKLFFGASCEAKLLLLLHPFVFEFMEAFAPRKN